MADLDEMPMFAEGTREALRKVLAAAPAEVIVARILDKILYTVDAISHETLENDKYRLRCFDSIRQYLFDLSTSEKAMALEEVEKKDPTPEERIQKALEIIMSYGGTDGAHHKAWVLDQIVRALVPDYEAWVKRYEYGDDGEGEDGEKIYEWDPGIPP
jgi:hypothetical protein